MNQFNCSGVTFDAVTHLTSPGPAIPGMEQRERPFDPLPSSPKPKEEGSGPARPETGSPLKDNLLKRMKKVDPKQAERYRQRTGE